MWYFDHTVLRLAKLRVEPGFQLVHRDFGGVAIVKLGERERKFGAKLFQGHDRFAGLRQNKIGGFEYRGKVVDQRARPIKNDIANHGANLTLNASHRHAKEFFMIYLKFDALMLLP
jgi:hypothetical protein